MAPGPHCESEVSVIQINQHEFAAQVNTRFRIVLGSSQTTEIELVQVADLGSTPYQEQFYLQFHGPVEVFLPQQVYRLAHETLGEADLFLVPIGHWQDGYRYEALFNRLITPEA